ncbi:hypothetical protein [Promicromonospora kroppenstedtii]|uniref:hypothetical protein n=1 Tax=Promicromonospora kroppenstedtii TaxID=440482 RepID=UPI0004BBF1BE|nr:hypothetical protein [Promicromonospora kroppenstedtii]
MKVRHPHIYPPVVIGVADERVESHLAAGWLLDEAPADEEAETPTPERPRRTRRAGSDSQKETAA